MAMNDEMSDPLFSSDQPLPQQLALPIGKLLVTGDDICASVIDRSSKLSPPLEHWWRGG